jgi:molybdopterin molybdotransferase
MDRSATAVGAKAMTVRVSPRNGVLLRIQDAAARARALVCPVTETECIPLGHALGRILAEPITALAPLPAFNNAAVDGYAFASNRFANLLPPLDVPIIDGIAAGQVGRPLLSLDGAVRILTGAAVPAGFDTVVMQEQCDRHGTRLTVNHKPAAGANVRLSGEDVVCGEQLLEAGLRIDARHVALAAAVGVAHVVVRRQLRAAVLSMGNELQDAGEQLSPAKVYDSNRPMIAALLASAGVRVTDLGAVGDDPKGLASIILDAAPAHDLIISSGGMSVGDADHVTKVMAAVCDRHDRLWMAVKPGKPAAIGSVVNSIWLALPGNAFAAFVAYLILGRPVLRTLAGYHRPDPPLGSPGAAAFQWKRKTGRDEFFPVRHVGLDAAGRPRVAKLGPGGSARLRPLADADGLAMVGAEVSEVQHGSALTYLAFGEAWCG